MNGFLGSRHLLNIAIIQFGQRNISMIKKISCFLFINLLLIQVNVFSQTSFKAKIVNEKDGKPVSYASVSIPKKKIGLLTDAKGFFRLQSQQIVKTDSIYFSSIGFYTLGLTFQEAQDISEFQLKEASKDLENVVVRSYTNEATEGSKSEVAGYFRSWPTKKTGAEIGKTFEINHPDYKVEKIRFKVNNQCDVCQIRVRIRSLVNGMPGELLMLDSISMPVKKLNFDDRYSEFDFTAKNIILKKQNVSVSLEVMSCNTSNPCSICFIGTEPGAYIYKNNEMDEWKESGMHSIYLKMYYKY
ncbi:MAG: carboxypeptidase-like regulatory domain-containing protein [Ferruginibacter sp.]